MRKPEQRLWDRLRKAREPDVLLMRVENMAGNGYPDVEALVGGLHTPIELKARPFPPVRDSSPALGTQYGLRTEQRNWHLEWARHEGRSLVVAQVGVVLFAIDGRMAGELNRLSLDDMFAYSLLHTVGADRATPSALMGLLRSTWWRRK
jgi:hypothetical protein